MSHSPSLSQPLSGTAIWDWKPVQVALETENRSFCQPFSSYLQDFPEVKVSLSRDFQYAANRGWHWHKSWILPTVIVALENQGQPLPENLCVEIFAVVDVEPDRQNERKLLDVGIKGDNKQQIRKPKGRIELKFNALKFDSTSYNAEKKKFHLLVVVYSKTEKKQEFIAHCCKLSPAIYVDSRKTASEPQMKENDYLKPYDPELNEKSFYKKKMSDNTTGHGLIGPNLNGLISYYTAANIRNKVKHPLFLAFRFPECCSLYYNPTKITETNTKEAMLQILQKLNDYESPIEKKPKRGPQRPYNPPKEQNLLILQISSIESNYLNKKIAELLGKFNNPLLHLEFDPSNIPSNYIKLSDSSLKPLYRELYDSHFKSQIQARKDQELPASFEPVSKRRPKLEIPGPQPLTSQQIKQEPEKNVDNRTEVEKNMVNSPIQKERDLLQKEGQTPPSFETLGFGGMNGLMGLANPFAEHMAWNAHWMNLWRAYQGIWGLNMGFPQQK